MEEKLPVTIKRSGFTRVIIFTRAHPMLTLGSIVGGLFIVFMVGLMFAGGVGYLAYNYTMRNPKFCITCHDRMIEPYKTWEPGEHAKTTCHTCHFTPEVITSHVKAILTGKPANKKISGARFHSAHDFIYKLHEFTMDETHCVTCHQDKEEKVHGGKTEKFACLNCHTDQTDNLEPERNKCLYCHSGDASVKEELARAGTLDARKFQPSEQTVQAAPKIAMPKDAAMMKLACRDCHKAHQKEDAAARKYDACLRCHPQTAKVGEHQRHLELVGFDCTQCHQQHSWKVTAEQAQSKCAKCHDYQSPMTFIGPQAK